MNIEMLLIIAAILAILFICRELYLHYFPSKQAFSSEEDLKKFLKLNEKQYKEIMLAAKQEFAKDVMDLLNLRDDKINENLAESDKKIRSVIGAYKDEIRNLCALNATADMRSFVMVCSMLGDASILDSSLCPADPLERHKAITALYFQLNPEAKDLVFVKS